MCGLHRFFLPRMMIEPTKVGICPTEMSTGKTLENVVERWGHDQQPVVTDWLITRPGNLLHNELERSTMFHGKSHYFYGDFP